VDVSFDESSGAIIVKPYRKKWTTVKLNRRVTEGDIDEAIEDAMNEFTKDIG